MSKTFPFYKQLDSMDCGPTSLKMVVAFHGKNIPLDLLRERSLLGRAGVSIGGISAAADSIGLKSLVLLSSYKMLAHDIPLPCIAFWKQRHFVVVYKITDQKVFVADPAYGLLKYTKAEFTRGWSKDSTGNAKPDEIEGVILVLEPTSEFYKIDEPGDVTKGFGFLASFLRPYHKLISQVFVGLVIGSIIQLIFPFLTQSLVDVGIAQNNLNFIDLILIGQLILFFSQTFANILRSWLLLHITSRVNISLLSEFLIKLMKLPIAFFESRNTGDLLQRIQDNTRIQLFLSSSTLNILFSSFNILIFSCVLFYYSVPIFLILLFAIIINLSWVISFMNKRAAIEYKRFDEGSGNQSGTIELLTGMQEIKLNGSEKRRRWQWELIQVRLFKLSLKSLTLSQFQTIGGDFILYLMGIIITFIAARQVVNGAFTLGTMLSIQFIIGQLNVPISSFVGFMQSYQDAKISLRRLVEIHEKDNEIIETRNNVDSLPSKRDIHFEQVRFRYGSGNAPWILDQVSFTIPEGKVTAIVGASGSGKTTMLKLALKFYAPQEGDIRIGSANLKNINDNFWRRNVGAVMQEGFIFADTIARNITESDSDGIIDKDRLYHAVQIANLTEFIEGLPNGYNTKIGARGMDISGGQKQRLLIARAVYKDPAILLFDEATSSLDANNESVIMKNLAEFYRSKTVVIVAHRLSTVKNADQIIVLNKGKIIEHGDHEMLTRTRGPYYSLIKNQLELGQ